MLQKSNVTATLLLKDQDIKPISLLLEKNIQRNLYYYLQSHLVMKQTQVPCDNSIWVSNTQHE